MQCMHWLHVAESRYKGACGHRLWHCWLEQPGTPWILELGFSWFGSCALFMSPEDAAYLLKGRMMELDPLRSGAAAWQCFVTFFREVPISPHALTWPQQGRVS